MIHISVINYFSAWTHSCVACSYSQRSKSSWTDQGSLQTISWITQGFKEKGRNTEKLGFPFNQFGKHESDTPAQIQEFAESKGVQFRMMEKTNVNGVDAHMVFKWITNLAGPCKIKSNFNACFVIDQEGDIGE